MLGDAREGADVLGDVVCWDFLGRGCGVGSSVVREKPARAADELFWEEWTDVADGEGAGTLGVVIVC